jgi:hypothetical protein
MFTHDVFVCYPSRDEAVARRICDALESAGIRCWIAPRDIPAGASYGGAIVDALDRAKLLVLVLSSAANNSPQVTREVERAVSKGLPIVPFRIESFDLSKDLEYFISSAHWLDATKLPRDQLDPQLVRNVQIVLARRQPTEALLGPSPPKPGQNRKIGILIGGAAIIVLAVSAVYIYA